ncbi:MAG TPA: hypothetical protein VML75_26880 [Kofleriaceae bacterium]|nr:hypothetical protein [Kofleriaceae bacterium]
MKRLVLVLALGLAALLAVLLWKVRAGGDGGESAAGDPSAREVGGPRLATGGPDRPGLRGPGLTPRELPPPPPDFNDGGMAAARRTGADRKLAAGEFPVRPPAFADPADRARFRAWWIDEYGRLTRIYAEHNPGDYPSDEETERLLEQLYDLGEPPRPGETAEQLDERQQAWFETWRDMTAAFGTPPKTVISFGADPQYGTGAEPPVLPDGAEPLEPDLTRPTMSEDELPPNQTPLGPAGPR